MMTTTQSEKNGDANVKQGLEKTRVRELTPPVDVFESEAELLIVADLAGVSPQHLDLRIEPPELRIEARPGGSETSVYRRSFTIDEHIDGEKVSAELKHGVLTVHLPKAAAVRPRKIEIRGA